MSYVTVTYGKKKFKIPLILCDDCVVSWNEACKKCLKKSWEDACINAGQTQLLPLEEIDKP